MPTEKGPSGHLDHVPGWPRLRRTAITRHGRAEIIGEPTVTSDGFLTAWARFTDPETEEFLEEHTIFLGRAEDFR